MYISFRKGRFSRNRKIDDETIIDLDEKGKMMGIELLNVSKRVPKDSLSRVNLNYAGLNA